LGANFENEDDIEIEIDSSLVYEMISDIDSELENGSSLYDRFDLFAFYYEKIFNQSIDKIDDLEELLANQEDKTKIYQILRNEIAHIYDKYFGITFDNLDSVTLATLYTIYQVIYLDFIKLLCFYAIGKGLEKGMNPDFVYKAAIEENKKEAVDISDYIVGNYIMNEDEFTVENIALALDKSDPGNIGYMTVFGNVIQDDEVHSEGVIIDNNAFRLRVKKEYNNPATKQLFEIVFSNFITKNIGLRRI
jgi:hypothetical protein